MRKKTAIQLTGLAIGTVLIAYLLYNIYRTDSDAIYWHNGIWYIEPNSTINNINNP